jgi:hypothetical protein
LSVGLGVFGQFLGQFLWDALWDAKITTVPLINGFFDSSPMFANVSPWQFFWAMIAVVVVWRFLSKFVRVLSGQK